MSESVEWPVGAVAWRVMGVMILALCADNITIVPHQARPLDQAADLLAPGGVAMPWSAEAMRAAAGEVLAGLLTVTGPSTGWRQGSGVAAEWIGAAIGAGEALGRFDTPQFLAETPLPVLKELAREAGLVGKATAGALRPALVGRAPNWRPEAAAFGAPAPRRREREA